MYLRLNNDDSLIFAHASLNCFRMHESIAAFPSMQFYGGQLITAINVTARPIPAWSSPSLPTYCFWNTVSNTKGNGAQNHFNTQEADFITNKLLSSLAARTSGTLSVGIISFYRDQGEKFYAHMLPWCV